MIGPGSPRFPHPGARPDDELLKTRDVAELLGLGLDTVIDHVQNPGPDPLPVFQLWGSRGGPLRYWRSEVLAWVERQRRNGTTLSADK